MLKNLKRKLYFLFVISIMFVFTIVFFLLTRENIETIQNAELSSMNRQATVLVLLFENSTNYVENLEICEKKYDYAFRLFTEQNKLLYESYGIEDTTKTIDTFLEKLKHSEIIYKDETESNHSFQTGIITFHSENGKTYHGVLCSIYTDTGYVNLVIVKEKSGITAFLPTIIYYFLIWLIVLIAVLLISILIIRQAIKPAEKTMQSQKDFIAGVSHELKTPLAVILSCADTLQALPDSPLEVTKQADIIDDEVSRMTRLVGDLLLLSSMDAEIWSLNISELNIDTFLIGLYEKYEPVCRKKNIHLDLDMDDDFTFPLVTDETRLEQILSAFLDNAVSYSSEDSTIILRAKALDDALNLSVVDHGVGIPHSQKSRIYERFFRVDKSRKDREHFGLGLSIANDLAEKLHGHISLADTDGGGCTFTLSLPLVVNDKIHR